MNASGGGEASAHCEAFEAAVSEVDVAVGEADGRGSSPAAAAAAAADEAVAASPARENGR